MSFHNGSVAHPQERYLSETVALTAALLLGRKRIYADYLTKWRRRVIIALFTAQQLLIFGAAGAIHLLSARAGFPGAAAAALCLAALVPATLVNLAVARLVVRRFDAAQADAPRWLTKPAPDGVYVYDLPLHDDFVTQLRVHLRLGVARDWDRTILARKAPRLHRAEGFPDLQNVLLFNWTWHTQALFEPQLLGTLAFACFLTLNLCWVYFFAAAVCLARSEEATRHWFEWEGRRRFAAAEAEREAAAQRQREEEAREAEARRHAFVVEIPGRRPPTSEQAIRDLPPELRTLIAAEPPTHDGAARVVSTTRPAEEVSEGGGGGGLLPA